ncbi:MAG: Hsp20/alpha crystallin family protein [Candidatus Borkfalkiaceae bacterium]|nr:Hsp20/alpha crystallin family protein [Christensenellaceae bacterium]
MKNYLVEKHNNDLFNEVFGDFFKPVFYGDSAVYMATDVKEKENSYELEIEMPGYNKEDISVDFEKGYLTVSAKKDEKQEEGKKYISRERHQVCRRSYYVGEIDENGITAKYENGVLSVDLPKRVEEQPKTKRISVE